MWKKNKKKLRRLIKVNEEAGNGETYTRVRKWESKPTQTPDPFARKSTWPYLVLPTTPPGTLGTNLKLDDRTSYPSRPRCRKIARTSATKAWKTRDFHLALPDFSPVLGDTTGWILFPTTPSSIPELDSGAVAARGRSLPVPLDPEWPKLLDLSFPVSVAWIPVTVVRRGQFGNFTIWGQFCISDPMKILVISGIGICSNYDSEGTSMIYDLGIF